MAKGKLQSELRKRKPFECLEEEATLGLLRTADQLQIRLTRLFREHGLTSSQYNILRILRGEGAPLPCLEVASRMIVAVPAITGLIDRLEAQGLVRRVRSNTDRRVIHVELTPDGKARLDALDDPLRAMHEGMLGTLGPEDLQRLIETLDRIRDVLDSRSPEGKADPQNRA